MGDYVWSENTETGEKEPKKVLSVSVTETTVLVHVYTEDGTEINTTENHPFFVEGKGWCAASELEQGDVLHTQDGDTQIVSSVTIEQLAEAVKVYNLEIEDSHTYYVSDRGVLVHNDCNVESSETLLLETEKHLSGRIEQHHIIPKFRNSPYADFISARGVDVDKYVIDVTGGKDGIHMNLIHGKGKWNQKWKDFIDSTPNATAKDIFQFAGKMLDEYGLGGYEIHEYRK